MESGRHHARDAVTITRHGRPAVVMLSVDDLEALQETLALAARSASSRRSGGS
ncbi:type II toxin-antitoxin system Phd/YefM family antitoxin [Microbacterium oxydans]|nr:type II toxin-antitoxin system Phd/YefM family antitoxin [Microbacterium oxydans]